MASIEESFGSAHYDRKLTRASKRAAVVLVVGIAAGFSAIEFFASYNSAGVEIIDAFVFAHIHCIAAWLALAPATIVRRASVAAALYFFLFVGLMFSIRQIYGVPSFDLAVFLREIAVRLALCVFAFSAVGVAGHAIVARLFRRKWRWRNLDPPQHAFQFSMRSLYAVVLSAALVAGAARIAGIDAALRSEEAGDLLKTLVQSLLLSALEFPLVGSAVWIAAASRKNISRRLLRWAAVAVYAICNYLVFRRYESAWPYDSVPMAWIGHHVFLFFAVFIPMKIANFAGLCREGPYPGLTLAKKIRDRLKYDDSLPSSGDDIAAEAPSELG